MTFIINDIGTNINYELGGAGDSVSKITDIGALTPAMHVFFGYKDGCALYDRVVNFNNQDSKEKFQTVFLGVKFASRISYLVYYVRIARGKNHLTDQEITKLWIRLMASDLVVNTISIAEKFYDKIRKGENPLTDCITWLDLSTIASEGLAVTTFISKDQLNQISEFKLKLEVGYRLHYACTHPKETLEKILNTANTTQDYFYFCYDLIFPLFKIPSQLSDADLGDVETEDNYELIPDVHQKNRVFRQFKCHFTNHPIRYPVIVLNSDGQPRNPKLIFERTNLLDYLCGDSKYPGTKEDFELADVKEHLLIRQLIDEEIQKLDLNLQ